MGRLFADAPGPRISPAQARLLGSQVPAGASIDRAHRTITFTTTTPGQYQYLCPVPRHAREGMNGAFTVR